MRLAAIDIGSNAARLLIVEVKQKELTAGIQKAKSGAHSSATWF